MPIVRITAGFADSTDLGSGSWTKDSPRGIEIKDCASPCAASAPELVTWTGADEFLGTDLAESGDHAPIDGRFQVRGHFDRTRSSTPSASRDLFLRDAGRLCATGSENQASVSEHELPRHLRTSYGRPA